MKCNMCGTYRLQPKTQHANLGIPSCPCKKTYVTDMLSHLNFQIHFSIIQWQNASASSCMSLAMYNPFTAAVHYDTQNLFALLGIDGVSLKFQWTKVMRVLSDNSVHIN